MNLFDIIGGRTLQIRDPQGAVLWEGVAEDGSIRADLVGLVWDLTYTDGTPVYHFRGSEAVDVPAGGVFTMSGDLRLSRF